MENKIALLCLTTLIGTPIFAAHIVTETRDGSTPVSRTHTYANAAGDLRMEEHGFSYSDTTSGDGATGNVRSEATYQPGSPGDITLYQSKGKAIVSLEGNICRMLTADSAPPPGLGGGNMADMQKQMADAMKQAGSAMEQAMEQARKEGMTPEQERAMKQFTQPFTEMHSVKPRGTLHITKLNESVRVGDYKGEGYLVSDEEGNEKHRIWVTPVGKISGAKHVRRAMQGMIDVYTGYLDKMGGAALMDTGLIAMFSKAELADSYPVRVEDLESGEITDVIEVLNDGEDADYYPACEKKSMMGM